MSIDGTTSLSYEGRLNALAIVPLAQGDVLDLAVLVVSMLPDGLDAVIGRNTNCTLTLIKLDA